MLDLVDRNGCNRNGHFHKKGVAALRSFFLPSPGLTEAPLTAELCSFVAIRKFQHEFFVILLRVER